MYTDKAYIYGWRNSQVETRDQNHDAVLEETPHRLEGYYNNKTFKNTLDVYSGYDATQSSLKSAPPSAHFLWSFFFFFFLFSFSEVDAPRPLGVAGATMSYRRPASVLS